MNPSIRQEHPRLSIVIVNYNGGDLVIDCLESLDLNPPTVTFEIIVVDNASRDDSAERIAERFPTVHLLRQSRNLGLTRGFNLGVTASRGDYILSLDNDTTVLPDAVDRMVEFLDGHPRTGACGSKLINPDGSPQRTARRFPTPMSALFGRHSLLTRWFPNNRFSSRYMMSELEHSSRPYAVDSLSTACMMVRREVIDQVGAYDEGFFVYWSDTDWCHRIKDGGWEIHTLPNSIVVHNENIKARHRKGRRTNMIIDFHRGAYRYYRKHVALSAWNPMNLVAIVGLSGRALLLILAQTWQQRAR